MTRRLETTDAYSGLKWVHLSRAEAHSLPSGRLNMVLWAIVAFLIGSGLFKLVVFIGSGAPLGLTFIAALVPVLTGLGLAARLPYALVLAVIMAGITLYSTMRAMGEGQTIWLLVDALVALGILFYLLEGDRPNLIYRYRFRKYSEARGAEEDDAE